MNFLLEFVTCSSSCSPESTMPATEGGRLLLVAQKRRRQKLGRQWRPSLSSISEDALAARRIVHERPAADSRCWRRNLKTKLSSISRTPSFDHDDARRRAPLPAIAMATFSPTPFMF
ncbi:Unknown protein [Striga hermonthica]|uniref:Uncharacterized protein n=1 Tax=Striga hermonthica TaxID=68872 RepID=A0A9N7R621_STRHE|nr:Unknown protein [Striga hermonthica]